MYGYDCRMHADLTSILIQFAKAQRDEYNMKVLGKTCYMSGLATSTCVLILLTALALSP